jgi:hypothetical protein
VGETEAAAYLALLIDTLRRPRAVAHNYEVEVDSAEAKKQASRLVVFVIVSVAIGYAASRAFFGVAGDDFKFDTTAVVVLIFWVAFAVIEGALWRAMKGVGRFSTTVYVTMQNLGALCRSSRRL